MTTAEEALRDRYFALALARGRAGCESEDAEFHALVDATPARAACELDGLGLAWHPTRAHKLLRYVPAERLPEAVRGLFARPRSELPELAAAFVDPRELSFFTFENIVGLDRLFVAPTVALGTPTALGAGVLTAPLSCDEATRTALGRLDHLGLYAAPLDPGARGGRRFVFHAAALAAALGAALRRALPEPQLAGFSHVNPVFRCSAFDADDAPFRWHQDTPYSDPARGHVSRTTLLIYLAGGRGAPALALEGGVRLDTIDAFTCVVFDQRLAHEGAPYLEGRKVFLRTELVYVVSADAIEHDPAIAALFGRACYLGAHGAFDSELARWAADAYDRAARAHFGDELEGPPAADPLLLEGYRGARWVTNGYDYWFPGEASLEECAALAIVDHLNGKAFGAAFRAATTRETLPGATRESIPALLAGTGWTSPFGAFDRDAEVGLLPEPELGDEGECCPDHTNDFDPTRCERVIEAYREAQRVARRTLQRSPIVVVGREILVKREAFLVRGGKIHVLGDRSLPPLNFAAATACWEDSAEPEDYVVTEREVTALTLLVPPISFASWRGCHHLMLDLFRNDWILRVDEERVVLPRIAREPRG